MPWTMVCIGPGPGPKNVLAEDEHGKRVVVPYAIWKHKLSKEATIATYKPFIGFVQFPVNDRETNGGTRVREVVIKPIAPGTDTPNLRITVWPDFEEVNIVEGDLVAADGKYTTNANNGKTYHNLSASALNVNGKRVNKVTDGVENSVEEEDEDFDPGF